MKQIPSCNPPCRPWLSVVLGLAVLVTACDKGAGTGLSAAAPSAAAPASSAPAASAATATALAPQGLSSTIAGTWRQICQPFLPGNGASDITYTITLEGADKVKLAGVAKDYKNTSCTGGGTVIATPMFVQRAVGTATVTGVPVLKLVDEGATASAPVDSKSVVGIENGQLRFGSANGARDSKGFPSQFEKPAEAYNKV